MSSRAGFSLGDNDGSRLAGLRSTMRYSEMENGAFCKYCVLFGQCVPRVKKFGILVNRPLISFKKPVDKLRPFWL